MLQNQGPAKAEQRFKHHFRRSLQMYYKHNLLHSWRSDQATESFEPDCPLQPTTGPRSCSRCTASTQSDSQWGLGPRCSYGNYWPLLTDARHRGPKNVQSWPRLPIQCDPCIISKSETQKCTCNNKPSTLYLSLLILIQEIQFEIFSFYHIGLIHKI